MKHVRTRDPVTAVRTKEVNAQDVTKEETRRDLSMKGEWNDQKITVMKNVIISTINLPTVNCLACEIDLQLVMSGASKVQLSEDKTANKRRLFVNYIVLK